MTLSIDDELPRAGTTPRPVFATSGRRAASARTHRLRMCLDLQMDALRAAFCAATVDTPASRLDPETAPTGPTARRPWQRWLIEDLDQAFTLAAIRAQLESGQQTAEDLAGTRTALRASLSDLTVHYQSIRDLLGELVDGPSRLSPGPAHEAARLAQQGCETRIRELRAELISTVSRDCATGRP